MGQPEPVRRRLVDQLEALVRHEELVTVPVKQVKGRGEPPTVAKTPGLVERGLPVARRHPAEELRQGIGERLARQRGELDDDLRAVPRVGPSRIVAPEMVGMQGALGAALVLAAELELEGVGLVKAVHPLAHDARACDPRGDFGGVHPHHVGPDLQHQLKPGGRREWSHATAEHRVEERRALERERAPEIVNLPRLEDDRRSEARLAAVLNDGAILLASRQAGHEDPVVVDPPPLGGLPLEQIRVHDRQTPDQPVPQKIRELRHDRLSFVF